jgi:hypothetical protein
MSEPWDSNLIIRRRQKIAGYQQRARVAKLLLVPALISVSVFGRGGGRLGISSIGVFFGLLIVIMVGEQQKCPRCEASLTRRSWWGEKFEGTCPECRCPID